MIGDIELFYYAGRVKQDLVRRKKTIVFVTHDIEESVYLADRIIIFSKRSASIKKIVNVDLERPRDRYTQKFLNFKKEVAHALFS